MTNFVPLDIVDGNGNPWRPKHFAASRPSPVGRPDTWCGGFNVYGWTREQLDAAKAEHEASNKALIENDKKPLPDWDDGAYMRTGKPSKLNGKAFNLEPAAEQYAELQRKAGRLGVQVVKLVPKGK